MNNYSIIKNLIIATTAIVLTSCGGTKQLQKGKNSAQHESVDFQEKFFAGQAEKATENDQKAYQLFQDALQISPDNDAVLFELARLEFQFKNTSSARELIQKAIALNPDNEWYHVFLADVFILEEMGEEAQKEYEIIVHINPGNVKARFELANLMQYQEHWSDAIKQFNSIEKISGVSESTALEKQRLYLKLGKTDKALNELLKLIAHFPNEVRYQGILADYYLEIGDEKHAFEVYENIKEIEPENGILHLKLSEFYASKGKDEKSFYELKCAFAATDVNIDQKIGILLNFYTASEYDPIQKQRAYELLDITVEAHPQEAKGYAMYGDFLLRDGRTNEAIEAYSSALIQDPSRNLIWSTLLQIESELGQFERMLTDAKEAQSLFPMMPEYYLYHAIACIQLEDFDTAIQSLIVGKELVIEDAAMLGQFYASLGDAYHATEKHEKSDNNYDKALEINPENVFVMNNYSYYLALRGEKLDQAISMAKRVNELQSGQLSYEDTYAWVLYKNGQFEEAKSWLEKALTHGGNQIGEVLEHYGDILFHLNLIDDAIKFWKEATQAGGGSKLLEKKLLDKMLYE